jgi:hypothetical protein
MAGQRNFEPSWEPRLEAEELLAEGTWWYDGKVPYSVMLKRLRYDYDSGDLESLEASLDPIHLDYVDYAINAQGEIYVWYFEGPAGRSESRSLSSLEEARRHIDSYGRVEIRWR